MKKLYIFLLLILIPCILLAQYKYDGRRIWPSTIDSTKFTSDRSAVIGPAVIGGVQLVEATRQIWFPASFDSCSTAGVLQGRGGYFLPSSNPASVTNQANFATFIFDAYSSDTDDNLYLTFVCPDDYKTDSMELYLYWFHLDDDGAVGDSVCWDGTVQALASAATDSGTSAFAAGTGMTAVYTNCAYSGPGSDATTDSLLYITNLDPEVEVIAANDLVTVGLFVDASATQLDTGEHVYLIGVLVKYEVYEVQ